jgi:hypothetical protein
MNGLDTRCHDIVEAAIGPEAGECWIRYGDDFDIGARVVNEDWVKRHAALPLTSVPVGLEIPCRDSYRVVKKRQLPITDFVNQNEIVDFVHVRVGGGPDRVLGFQPHNLGLIVFAMLSDTDAAMVSKEMQARRLTPICRAAKGEVVVTQRGTNPLRGAFHVYAGDAVPMEQQMAMNARFASLIKPRL